MIAAQVQKCNRELDAAFDALYRPARLLQKVTPPGSGLRPLPGGDQILGIRRDAPALYPIVLMYIHSPTSMKAMAMRVIPRPMRR